MSRKTAIVTGASRGFGMFCTIELAKAGFHVIATMRNVESAETLINLAKKNDVFNLITLHPLDVTSRDSIHQLKKALSHYRNVDMLLNNAGFALGGFSEEIPIEEYRSQFETNFFGVIAVTQAILPIMRAQGHGRIINMSSISGRFGFPGLSPYTASKHALEGYSESLRLELRPYGIDVVLVEPGSYQTNIWASVDAIEMKADSPYRSYLNGIVEEIKAGKTKHGDPQEVARLVAQIALQSNRPKLRYPIGKGVKMNLFLKSILPWKMLESIILNKISKTVSGPKE
ncbi:SDR family oxidoreductase [Neobacillus sp. LXY-4]|uniref:SDR family oxidoreductase n=1 Tax=Neobacillus sp. LXY-4 TaxID=3379826 RepID=UPI003EDECE65